MKHTKLHTDLALIIIEISDYDVEYVPQGHMTYQALFAVGVETVICFPHDCDEFTNDGDTPCFLLLLKNDETLAETTAIVQATIDGWITTSIKDHATELAIDLLGYLFADRTVSMTSSHHDIFREVGKAMVEEVNNAEEMMAAIGIENADTFIDPSIDIFKEKAVALLINT